jgi:hypothetical protein
MSSRKFRSSSMKSCKARREFASSSSKGTSSRRDALKIVREFPRYPLGLAGGNSVQFILGTGLKEPAGDLGHSCIRSETTGLPLHPSAVCTP